MIVSWHGRAVSENRRLRPSTVLINGIKQPIGVGRLVPNKDYKAFKESIAWTLRCEQLDKSPIKGPVSVRLFMELNPRMDAQNVIKPVLDALELAGVIKNDKQVRTFSFHREDRAAEEEDRIGILVQEMKDG